MSDECKWWLFACVAYYEDAVIFYWVVDVFWGEIMRQFDSFLIYNLI